MTFGDILAAVVLVALVGGILWGLRRAYQEIKRPFVLVPLLLLPAGVSAQSTLSVGLGWTMYDQVNPAPARWGELVDAQYARGSGHGYGHHDDEPEPPGTVIVERRVYEYVRREQTSGVVLEAVAAWGVGRLQPNVVASWELSRAHPVFLPQLSVVAYQERNVAFYAEAGATGWDDDWQGHVGGTVAGSLSEALAIVTTLRAEPGAEWRPTVVIKADVRLW